MFVAVPAAVPEVMDKGRMVLGALPLSQLFATLLLVIIVVYALADRLKSFLVWAGGQFWLYMTIRERTEALAAAYKIALPKMPFNPFVYMDRALAIASGVPPSDLRFDLVVPIIVAVITLYVYGAWLLLKPFQHDRNSLWVPLFNLLLVLSLLGGGTGLIRYLRINEFAVKGFSVSWFTAILLFHGVYAGVLFYVFFARHARGISTQSSSSGSWLNQHDSQKLNQQKELNLERRRDPYHNSNGRWQGTSPQPTGRRRRWRW